MTDRLVTIATFSKHLQAELLKAKLEGKGIKCVLTEDPTHSLYGYAAGAIRLQVKESDTAQALEILRTNEKADMA
jgi:thymidylate kinase